jgi:hypothetical protein
MITNDFKVGYGLQKGAGLAPTPFNRALEYVMRQQSVEVNSTTFHKSVHLVQYEDDKNIIGRTKEQFVKYRATKGIGLNIRVEKNSTKSEKKHIGKGCLKLLLTYIEVVTYLLTPWSRVLLEKPTSKHCS